jgi:hypothetical protein
VYVCVCVKREIESIQAHVCIVALSLSGTLELSHKLIHTHMYTRIHTTHTHTLIHNTTHSANVLSTDASSESERGHQSLSTAEESTDSSRSAAKASAHTGER